MEAFEQFVAVALQEEKLVVSGPMKFAIKRRTKKEEREEHQTHGYEVDLVAARADKLILATVKSFFGSKGVQAREVNGTGGNPGGYRMLNDVELRDEIVVRAAERFGFRKEQVFVRLYVGKFAGKDEAAIRAWCSEQHVGGGVIQVVGIKEVIEQARKIAAHHTYTDNPVIVAMKALAAAGALNLDEPLVASNEQVAAGVEL